MPILGLTTGRLPRFPTIGELRKGSVRTPDDIARKRPGKDLDYFRFTSGVPGVLPEFVAAYGEQPRAVNAFLVYDTLEENLETWQEEWDASRLVHRCNGQWCTRVHDPKTNRYVDYLLTPEGQPANGKGKECPGRCKATGRLWVWLPELKRGGVVLVQTTSIHDCANLAANLLQAQEALGKLKGVPFILQRVERQVSSPMPDGSRRRFPRWLLHLEIHPLWFAAKLSEFHRLAVPAGVDALLLPGTAQVGERVIDVATGEVVDETQLPPDTEDEADDGEVTDAPEDNRPSPNTSEVGEESQLPANNEVGQLAYYDELFAQAKVDKLPDTWPLSSQARLEPMKVAAAIKKLEGKLATKGQQQ